MQNGNAFQTEQQALRWPQERGVRVLVVNDYADNVESMAKLLRLYGHEVDTALGGPAALRAAQANPPHSETQPSRDTPWSAIAMILR
jgi:CheY-like chemotaxis protein